MALAREGAVWKFPKGIATGFVALGLSLLLLADSAAEARGLRIRVGGGPVGVVRSVAGFALGSMHGRRLRMARAQAAAAGPSSRIDISRMDVTRGPDAITRPVARLQVAAVSALAGWHGQRGASGWWQHSDGVYGWVGPLFWPFAYYDIYDYTLWGDGMGFWGYGYRDIYAAVFTPYDPDELARYVSPPQGRKFRRFPSLERICSDDAGEFSALPVEQLRQAISLSSEEQRAMLDDLTKASVESARTIRAACPAEVAATPSGRLAAMQQRLEAMKAAIARIRTPFETFYESLDDDQKGNLAAFNAQRAPFAPKVPAAQSCTAPEALPWPSGEIAAGLHPNDAQRELLDRLSRISMSAKNTLNFNCQPDDNLSPPDRLATADTRLDAMLDAIRQLRPALDDFYGSLSDEQKSELETIGAKRTS
jgi:hypothetical protein